MIIYIKYYDKKPKEKTKYQLKPNEYINRIIYQSKGFNANGYPCELFRLDMEWIGILLKRKSAKVISFQTYKGCSHDTIE